MKKSEINILIVEDDKSVREALVEAVNRSGYRAVAVGKPDEAESIVKIKPIHGLILDVMLPGRNGVDLALRLKENLIDGATIFFISGIYKDRAFIGESLKKVDAAEYFVKPFHIDRVILSLDSKLSEFIETPKVDLHGLLSSPFASNRERRKALDHVEEMNGFDLPFVFCILMDAESSGHLNIVDQNQNIYGVTFSKGNLARIDSESTLLFTKKLLVQHGFVTELELSEIKSKSSGGDLIRNLVSQGLMSPHAPAIIKLEAIAGELSKLFTDSKLKINFVPDRKIKSDPDDIDLETITPYLHDLIDKKVTISWLKKFYRIWAGHPIRLGPQFSDYHQLVNLPLLKQVDGILEQFKKESTIEEVMAQCPQYTEEYFYKALHLLMLRRILVFEEVKRVKNIDEHVNRLKSIYKDLKGKNPIEIFKYFGLGERPKPQDVVKTYKEFAKSHHPDTLPQAISADIKALNHELFSNVTVAFETLSDPNKKEKFFNEMKQQEAELQIKSDELVTTATAALMRGKYAEALPLLEAAIGHYESERSLLHFWWVCFKMEGKLNKDKVTEIEKKLKAMSPGMRKTATWIFISGLIKRFNGDNEGAKNDFNRVISLDESFMDARRELVKIESHNEPEKMNSESILTGDISVVLKNIFKKNKGA